MAIFPLPPSLTARLNIPPPYKIATEDTAPPPYNLPLQHRISTFRPQSIPLPPSPSPSPSPSPTSTHQTPPPEYSPSVYSQQEQQRLSHYLPSPDTVDPSSPRASKAQQQQQHASHFVENRTDLSMRAGLEGARGELGGKMMKKRSVFRLYAPVKAGQVERGYWKRGVVVLGGFLVVVLVVVVVVVAVWGGLRGKRS